jgi:dTDP-4-dehydrorhamnose reductase
MIDLASPGVVISGDTGRLGSALHAAAVGPVDGWDYPELDLDDPASGAALVEQRRPRLVIHTAAMTAVDQAAREPELAMRRNGEAVGAMARACRALGAGFVLISTNEVFDGERSDGRGYREDDPTAPRNPYGASKRAGEEAALAAYRGHRAERADADTGAGAPGVGDAGAVAARDGDPSAGGLWIVRTAWLFGPPGADFPEKITAAADKVEGPLPVVSDEVGSPTYTHDLAGAIYELVERTDGGIFHLVNAGTASRLDWARAVLDVRRPGRELVAISRSAFQRASDPPPWGVLDTAKAASAGVTMRPWRHALAEYLADTDVAGLGG